MPLTPDEQREFSILSHKMMNIDRHVSLEEDGRYHFLVDKAKQPVSTINTGGRRVPNPQKKRPTSRRHRSSKRKARTTRRKH